MPSNIDSRAVTVSAKIYERLLASYPSDFRREYGPAMKQLFRDQCRDAWTQARGRGLAALWLRVLADWAKTSVVEHFANLCRGETLRAKVVRAFRADSPLRAAYCKAFVVVFVCALVCGAIAAISSPLVYFGTVRVEGPGERDPSLARAKGVPRAAVDVFPRRLPIQSKIIEAYPVLTNIILKLRLDEKLAQENGSSDGRYRSSLVSSILNQNVVPWHLDEAMFPQTGRPCWSMDKTLQYLVDNLSVAPVPGTRQIKISVRNTDPDLAAMIANALLVAYPGYWDAQLKRNPEKIIGAQHIFKTWMFSFSGMNRDLTRASDLSLVRTKPRIFFVWACGGTLLALGAGAGSAWLARQNSAR